MNDASPSKGGSSDSDGKPPNDRDDPAEVETESEPMTGSDSLPSDDAPKPASERDRATDALEEPLPSRFERMRAFVRARYMHVDPRTAGIFRIVLGFLLTADTLRHWGEARLLYSNVGVLSNEYHLWRPSSSYQLSFFHAFSTLGEVHVCFALGVLCHLLLFAGYRSRLFAFLSFVFVTSMDQRIPLVENGGYVVVNLACLWACFLPVGQRFGFDAWKKSWRARRERDVETLNDRTDFAGERRPLVSLIGLIVLFNLSAVYFWNVVNKAGWIWRVGHTVHYVLYLNRMVTTLAIWSRAIPEPILMGLDWTVLSIEALVCVFIFSPAAKRYTRPLAMLGMLFLHGTFGIMMRLGPFSWFLIGCSTLLLTPYQFADIERWYTRRAPRIDVALKSGSALALALGRALSRLDGYERITFVKGGDSALVSVRESGADAAFATAPDAVVARVAAALPLGRFAYLPIRVVTLGALPRLLAWADRHEERIAKFFDLSRPLEDVEEHAPSAPERSAIADEEARPSWLHSANGWRFRKWFAFASSALVVVVALAHLVPENAEALVATLSPSGVLHRVLAPITPSAAAFRKVVAEPDSDRYITSYSWCFLAVLFSVILLFWPAPRSKPALLRERVAARVFRSRELFLTYYAIASLSQTWNENKGIPPVIKYQQPQFVQMTINYPRLFQGWGMFAPNPIQEDGVLVVDGYTLDGRHVDPYNGGTPDLDLTDTTSALGISQLRQDYGNRIRLDHNQLYRDELKGYLMRWQEETGNPNDELVAFDVYWVRDKCPPVGSDKATDNDPVALVSYRKPGYRRPLGAPPIPAPPKIRSGELWDTKPTILPTLVAK